MHIESQKMESNYHDKTKSTINEATTRRTTNQTIHQPAESAVMSLVSFETDVKVVTPYLDCEQKRSTMSLCNVHV